jgi:glycosyltransferase involved in cell wall biosynthesis
MKRLLVIEPICTGSRLLYLDKVIQILSKKYFITVITRSNYRNDYYNEVGKNVEKFAKIITVNVDLDGVQIRNLNMREWFAYCKEIIQFDKSSSDKYDILFMALDDYFLSFTISSFLAKILRNANKSYAIKYRVGPLLNPLYSIRNIILYTFFIIGRISWGIQYIQFDERLKEKFFFGSKILWIPDFWSGDFNPAIQSEARNIYGYRPNDFIVLLIGTQDNRKGIVFILESLPTLFSQIPDLKVCVHGKVHDDYIDLFEEAQKLYGNERIQYFPKFIPESQLHLPYAAASIVALPYNISFNATSGVLPRSAASGVPVVASSHGLISYRVSKHFIGELFDYGDVKQFLNAITKTRSNISDYQNNLKDFSDIFSESNFVKVVENIFDVSN